MRRHSLPKTVSLALAAMMMMLTLGAIDQLAAHGSPAVQMAATATQTAKAATPVQRSTPSPRS